MIVGLSGLIGSGKGSVAQILVNDYGYKQMSFAGSLKDAVSSIFGWDRSLLEGDTKESRAWRETVDTWWAKKLNIPHLTPRWILQHFGTDVVRHHFCDDIWMLSLENKLRNTKANVIISDVRFPNEIKVIRDLNGSCVRVMRGADPDWCSDARVACSNSSHATQAKAHLSLMGIHESEWAWYLTVFDYVVENNGTLDDLRGATHRLVDHLSSTESLV